MSTVETLVASRMRTLAGRFKEWRGRMTIWFESLGESGTYCEQHKQRENWESHMAAWQKDHRRQHPECLKAARREARREKLLKKLVDTLEEEDESQER